MMPLVVLGLGRPKVVGKGPQDARDRLHDWGWVDAHLRGPRGHWHHLLLDEPDEERAELEADPLASPGALRDAPSSATKAFMSSLGARFPLAICFPGRVQRRPMLGRRQRRRVAGDYPADLVPIGSPMTSDDDVGLLVLSRVR